MAQEKEAIHEVGIFRVEVFGSGRRNRYTSSKFNVRCDAIGLHEREILLLSVIGPETSVKALTAGLRASGNDQKRIEYSASVESVEGRSLSRCSDGYRVYRTKLDYDQWHVLFLAKRVGFMPVMTDDALWRHLQGEEFTTPLLRDWVPWLKTAMQRRELLVCLEQSGCQAGIVLAENADLDELVSQGLKKGDLTIRGHHGQGRARRDRSIAKEVTNLDEYMLAHGSLLGKQAERSLNPLHVPGRDTVPTLDLLRDPFDAQAHVIEATRKALARQKALMLVGEISHRVLNEYTHAIATLAIARAETTDLRARNALAAAERRLRAHADVHRALRPPPAGQPYDLGNYLAEVNDAQLRRTFAEMAQQKLDAAVVDEGGSFLAQRALIVELAGKHRLPVIYPYRDYVDAGGLMAYAPELGELAQRMANDVHQILNGARPGA